MNQRKFATYLGMVMFLLPITFGISFSVYWIFHQLPMVILDRIRWIGCYIIGSCVYCYWMYKLIEWGIKGDWSNKHVHRS